MAKVLTTGEYLKEIQEKEQNKKSHKGVKSTKSRKAKQKASKTVVESDGESSINEQPVYQDESDVEGVKPCVTVRQSFVCASPNFMHQLLLFIYQPSINGMQLESRYLDATEIESLLELHFVFVEMFGIQKGMKREGRERRDFGGGSFTTPAKTPPRSIYGAVSISNGDEVTSSDTECSLPDARLPAHCVRMQTDVRVLRPASRVISVIHDAFL
ncbi:unnamed protein product [Acanthoscelides obtectus]|uniref:Uncharacterized protein n=1 Tax=Acanthoscelides obtectus TaxID=200917 RepID=A0A9P0MKQ3_ACAOB|nr:unnamed protein product [Acanthoscelides obtectus]CAK1660941.1 hypothetical protein AOBTE_LOCUS22350 [Acanthoscelides obtectus]